MELNPETLASLSSYFLNSLSPHPDLHHHAESSISAASDQPSFFLAVLSLLSSPSADPAGRHSASVNFKNHLRSFWAPSETLAPVSGPEKERIKAQIAP